MCVGRVSSDVQLTVSLGFVFCYSSAFETVYPWKLNVSDGIIRLGPLYGTLVARDGPYGPAKTFLWCCKQHHQVICLYLFFKTLNYISLITSILFWTADWNAGRQTTSCACECKQGHQKQQEELHNPKVKQTIRESCFLLLIFYFFQTEIESFLDVLKEEFPKGAYDAVFVSMTDYFTKKEITTISVFDFCALCVTHHMCFLHLFDVCDIHRVSRTSGFPFAEQLPFQRR